MTEPDRDSEVPQFVHRLDAYTLGEIRYSTILRKGEVCPRYVYIGPFLNNMMQGYGLVISPMGICEGEWDQGLFHAQGTEIWEEGYSNCGRSTTQGLGLKESCMALECPTRMKDS
jgi:hypothetical protein